MNGNAVLEDDSKESVTLMIEHRLPWLAIGLIGGMLATVLASRFEDLLSANIKLSFFIPVIVYMADAVGTQTESVFVRNLGRSKKVKFLSYLFKELLLGIFIGLLFGIGIGGFSYVWFGDLSISLTVGLAMFATITVAPVVALIISEVLFKEHTDPALGSGPFGTVIQDLLSLFIYFTIAGLIIL